MTPNILEYSRKTLNLKILIRLYQKPLNFLNITYTLPLITSSGFEDLKFIILSKIDSISKSKKTIIFVDSIKIGRNLAIYIQSFLLNNLKDKGDNIIGSFLFILEVKTKTNWLENFLNCYTRITICTNIEGINIDIPDI